MGANEEAKVEERSEKIVKAWIVCLVSFLISMLGGMVLVCWELKHHKTNSQLWMVPFGLILFITPILAYLAVVISDVFTTSKAAASEDDHSSSRDLEKFVVHQNIDS